MTGLRVLVCGGRNFKDKDLLNTVLTILNETKSISMIIHGGAPGADRLAGEFAKTNRIKSEVYYASWNTYGRSAGPLRNAEMLAKGRPDVVVAFPGGKGTSNMIEQSNKANVPVVKVSKETLNNLSVLL